MIDFQRCSFEEIKEKVSEYFRGRDILVDSFFEQYALKSNYYKIMLKENNIGFFGISGEELITLFHVDDKYSFISQEVFHKAKKMEQVSECFVATGDEPLVSLCMDNYQNIVKQAYFSRYPVMEYGKNHIELIEASIEDKDLIEENSGDFFDDVEVCLKNHQLYIVKSNNNLVGFGIIEMGIIRDDLGSIGMFVLESERRKGYGKSILQELSRITISRGKKTISGCWYYNHNSLKTQFSAGAYCHSRLLRFKF